MVIKMTYAMITLAMFFFVLAIYYLFFRGKRTKNIRARNKLMIPVVCLFVSVFLMRIAMYSIAYEKLIELGHNIPEVLARSFIHSLQSFSLDEDYEKAVKIFQTFVEGNVKPPCSKICMIFIMFENALAPVLGGAFILDVICDIFPRLRLYRITFFRKSRVCIFSELNPEVMALATNLKKQDPRAAIVISDTYVSQGDESQTDRLEKAKRLGAICVSEDIMDIKATGRKLTEYFLMDSNEEENMRSLASLSTNESYRKIWKKGNQKVMIHFFTDNEGLDSMIENANEEAERNGYENVIFKIVSISNNLSYSLLKNNPLYEVVESEEGKQKISVAIFGDTPLGRKFFETVYWSGQMLNPYLKNRKETDPPQIIPLSIHMIIKGAKQLQNHYSRKCPEIFPENIKNNDSVTKDSVKLTFAPLNVNSIDKTLETIKDANYILVHTGNDYQNIRLAEEIKYYFDKEYISRENKINIHVIVEDDDLFEIQKKIFEHSKGYASIHLYGNMKERYQYDELYTYSKGHDKKIDIKDSLEAFKQEKKDFKNMYNNRSSYASDFYLDTRFFSAKCLSDKKEEMKDQFRNYLKEKDAHNLKYWEEKNRWNAYSRVRGYQSPTSRQVFEFYEKKVKEEAEDKRNASPTSQEAKKMQKQRFEFHKEEYRSKKVYYLHSCLLDLPKATGNPFEKGCDFEWEDLEGYYNNLPANEKGEKPDKLTTCHKFLMEKLEGKYFNVGINTADRDNAIIANPQFQDFLIHLRDTYFRGCPNYDALDMLSILSCNDYKDNDRRQVEKWIN